MISFLKKYGNKFRYAFAGLMHGLLHDRSIVLQAVLGMVVLAVCACLGLEAMEWCVILIVIGAVIALEYINSALETIVDMVSPQYSEGAKKAKDYAAAAVLVMSLAAAANHRRKAVFMNVNEQYQELLDAAFAAMQHAYAPYSRYHVGACVKTKDGTLIPGANIENASFGLTNCAERSAIFAAYSMGYRREDIVAIAIVSDGTKLAAPCGACRQVLVELLQQDTPIVLSNKQEQKITSIAELLPMSFTSEDVL